jgi:hypothetical protein
MRRFGAMSGDLLELSGWFTSNGASQFIDSNGTVVDEGTVRGRNCYAASGNSFFDASLSGAARRNFAGAENET